MEARIYYDTSYNQTTYHEALKIFIAYLKQRFMHSTHVQSMADIDPTWTTGPGHVYTNTSQWWVDWLVYL